MSKKKLIIDVDTGTDDAEAIMLALSHPDADVVAITCVYGNTTVDQVCLNTLRVLKVCGRLDIPVYKGVHCAIVGDQSNIGSSGYYHGRDGLGDNPDPEAPTADLVQKEHATSALIRLSKEQPGELTLIALAPLTNIALALRLDPNFGKRLKQAVIMGGNMSGAGSRDSATADFNFRQDPEAARVCMAEIGCSVYLVPYDVCQQCSMSWDWVAAVLAEDTPKSKFIATITAEPIRHKQRILQLPAFFTCDPLAVMVALNKETVLKEEQAVLDVELSGKHTRGLSVVRSRHIQTSPHKTSTGIDHVNSGKTRRDEAVTQGGGCTTVVLAVDMVEFRKAFEMMLR